MSQGKASSNGTSSSSKSSTTRSLLEHQPETLDQLQKVIEEEANEAVKVGLPKQILAIDKLYKEICARVKDVRVQQKETIPSESKLIDYAQHLIEKEDQTCSATTTSNKKRKGQDGSAVSAGSKPEPPNVGANSGVAQVLKDLSKQVIQGIELLGKVKTWIQLRIPKIEAGNNFGVAVQEECVGELHRVEDAGFAILEATTKYHCQRSRLSHKLVKHPLVQDYRQAILECDDAQCDLICLTALDMRNSLFVLHDLLTKNFEKLLKPRNDNGAAHMMY